MGLLQSTVSYNSKTLFSVMQLVLMGWRNGLWFRDLCIDRIPPQVRRGGHSATLSDEFSWVMLPVRRSVSLVCECVSMPDLWPSDDWWMILIAVTDTCFLRRCTAIGYRYTTNAYHCQLPSADFWGLHFPVSYSHDRSPAFCVMPMTDEYSVSLYVCVVFVVLAFFLPCCPVL